MFINRYYESGVEPFWMTVNQLLSPGGQLWISFSSRDSNLEKMCHEVFAPFTRLDPRSLSPLDNPERDVSWLGISSVATSSLSLFCYSKSQF